MFAEDYVDVPYPHYYLTMWLECKRYALPNGAPALPEPDKAPDNQDADLMLAFEVLEEEQIAYFGEQEARARNKAAAQQIDGFSFLNEEDP